ncbi:hypothetical protein JRX38_00950 [Gluconobacter cerinus]|uniref:hypothetical protein n=1 Tax=Gluconobacter cerinus TaxID=38307 RepID=UPI00193FE869|nr:hypothetical protein [Gluconobacter cerinus]MBM3096602.1 hypothetical protein [Gluconobacter cerinus]
MKKILLLAIPTILAGCTTASSVPKPGGGAYHIIGCGTAAPLRICYERANKECPTGYKVISTDNDGVRKELTIDCDK